MLAGALQGGRGVAIDKAAELDWYQRAADKGDAGAARWVAAAERCKKAGMPLSNCL